MSKLILIGKTGAFLHALRSFCLLHIPQNKKKNLHTFPKLRSVYKLHVNSGRRKMTSGANPPIRRP